MEIYLNLDGVVFDIIAGLDKALEKQNKIKYDYSDWIIYNKSNDYINNIINNNLFWKNLKPFEDAWHQINYWFSIGHTIIGMSCRESEIQKEILEESLDNWRISCSLPVYLNNDDKHNLIPPSKTTLVIDDNPQTVLFLIEKNINAVMRRAWYNKPFWDTVPNIGNLYEIVL